VLAYDSGSSAKLIRLLGVDMPELEVLPPPRTLTTTSGKLSAEGVFKLELERVEVGVGGTEDEGVEEGGDRFMADCRGGEGGRVEEECVPLVNRREIDAVAVEVPASATGAGVRGKKGGARKRD
jgi:hypothetical protein